MPRPRFDALPDPRPDRIGAASEMVGEVRVEALHPAPCAPDPAPLLRAGMEPTTVSCVLLVRPGESCPKVGIQVRLIRQTLDPPLGFQSGYRRDRLRTRQPVQRREWLALEVRGAILNNQGMAGTAPGDHREGNQAIAPELFGDGLPVRWAGQALKLTHAGVWSR
jgi:hypothetical protein